MDDFRKEKFKKIDDPLDKIKDQQKRLYAKKIRAEINPRHRDESRQEKNFDEVIIPVSRKERAIIDECVSKFHQLGEIQGIFRFFGSIITDLSYAKEISYGDIQLCLLLATRMTEELDRRRDEDTRVRGFIKKIFTHIIN